MLQGDPRRLTTKRKTLLHRHSSTSRSCRSSARLLVFTCLHESVFYTTVRLLAPTSALVLEHLSRSARDRVTQSLSQAQLQNAMRRPAVEVIMCMITRDFSVISIDVTSLSFSLSLSLSLSPSLCTIATHKKSLPHNIPSASGPGIIVHCSVLLPTTISINFWLTIPDFDGFPRFPANDIFLKRQNAGSEHWYLASCIVDVLCENQIGVLPTACLSSCSECLQSAPERVPWSVVVSRRCTLSNKLCRSVHFPNREVGPPGDSPSLFVHVVWTKGQAQFHTFRAVVCLVHAGGWPSVGSFASEFNLLARKAIVLKQSLDFIFAALSCRWVSGKRGLSSKRTSFGMSGDTWPKA